MIKYFLDAPALPSIDLRFERKTDGASGYDLMANIGVERIIAPGARWVCHTGLYLEMPIGIEGQVRTRSGLSRDHGIVVINAPGTIDSDYRGEITVTLLNTDRHSDHTILPGDRIAQIVFCPVLPEFCDLLYTHRSRPDEKWLTLSQISNRDQLVFSTRGTSGHGSTGR